MKRTALKRKTPLTAKTQMRKVSAKKLAYRASKEGQNALDYMRKVKQLSCVVCGAPGPSDAHHPICDRYGTRKASDFDVIPLCVHCHRYPHPNAIHTNKRAWVERNGPDYGYIDEVRRMVAET